MNLNPSLHEPSLKRLQHISPEYIVPVLFDKVDLLEGYLEPLADPGGVLGVPVRCTHTLLVPDVPVAHEEPEHLIPCGCKAGPLSQLLWKDGFVAIDRLTQVDASCFR